MLTRVPLFIQPQLMRVHVARKAKRHNKLARDKDLKRRLYEKERSAGCYRSPRPTGTASSGIWT